MANRLTWSNDKKPYGSSSRGSMVVLSRPRSGGPKLSVPPPLNLPSLRKEHQKFDSLGNSNGGSLTVKSSSSSIGWDHGVSTVSSSITDVDVSSNVQKHTVFRGEDFPSLRATLTSNSNSNANLNVNVNVNENSKKVGNGLSVREYLNSGYEKQSDSSQREEISRSRKEGENSGLGLSSSVDMGSREKRVFDNRDKKEGDFLPLSIPLVRLSSRSDWEDDERDTSFALTDAKSGYSTNSDYWHRDFDFPRSSFPPIKPTHIAKSVPSQVSSVDPFSRGVRVPSREGYEGQSRRTHLSNTEVNNGGNDSNKYKVNVVQKSTGIRSSSSFGNKGHFGNNCFGRENSSSLRNEKPYVEDPFSGFDSSDPFPGSILGVVMRKKDTSKQIDFHDPARESFEAELERVQKIQEQERQRVIDEQERAMEMARREEEERERVVREQKEHHRRLEQERMEAIRREEEKRSAREEEKQRILMEEERRKQAAKQKLIELEEKMAKRHSEIPKEREILPGIAKERDIPRADDFSSWEDGERMVERITNSASSNSSLTRPFDLGSRTISSERSKPFNSQRRDVFENGNNSSFFYSKRGYMPESQMDDISYGNGYPYGRNMDFGGEFPYNMGDRFDLGWGQGRGRGNPPFPERFYPNPDSDEIYTYGRSRYTVRQPRVLPPPLPLVQRTSFREESANNEGQSVKNGEQEDLDRKPTPGHDSQLSLSVSSPPSSPTHLSHDDLDESRECLDVFSREKDQNTLLSENEALLVENTVVKSASSSVSVVDDEEWETENNGEIQEEFDEENEVQERGNENIELNREFEEMRLEGNDSLSKDNLVLGFDEGVEVGMPNEDFEKSQTIDEGSFVEPKESFDSNRDELSSQPADVSKRVATNESKSMVQETKEEIESPNLSNPLNPLNSGHSTGTFKLQFGLFSGPSLIPSPIPSIQIGSIQMPLQIHPQIGPTLTHIQTPQPPVLQFGQIQCPPISQGILPLTPESMSFVQTNVPPMYCSSQVLAGPPLDSSQSSEKDDSFRKLKVDQDYEFFSRSSSVTRNTKPLLNNRASESRASQSIDNVKDSSESFRNRGRKLPFKARNPEFRSFSSSNETSHMDVNVIQRKFRRGPQRFEFRVRQTVDGRPLSSVLDSKSNSDEISGSSKRLHSSHNTEGILKRNISSEDEIDAPLQNGVVKVFKQPGIEARSDEDDFIQVRSKRQMLHDRREKREKESKEKSSNIRKGQRKSRSSVQSSVIAQTMSRSIVPSSGQVSKSQQSTVAKRGLPPTLSNVISQQLPPIGTPCVTTEYQANGKTQVMKTPQTNTCYSNGRVIAYEGPNGTFDTQNQPVMALTQTQLEDAMKPAQFSAQSIPIGVRGTSVHNPGMPSSSIIVKDSPFSFATRPINSLLSGEKIQFGALTSSTTLFPSTNGSALSNWPNTLSLPSNNEMSKRTPTSQNNCDIILRKEKKRPDESIPPLEDCEEEAEAVVVATIGNDEVVGNGIGPICVSQGFRGDVTNGMKTGLSDDQHVVMNQSKPEDSLSITLPSDLSVETSPISIWPPLTSPHSSTQILSPSMGPPTSPFPFYDMNPIIGGPVFSFGPNGESSGPNQQLLKNSLSSSGLLGTWQQCQTGVDSFYGPPSGFPVHYISQGPPQMVVYNHFAPIGQFGHVGLSYMGTTYIPSSKQPDWKHNSESTLGNEGQMSSTNPVPLQGSAPNLPPIPNLSSGSPLVSMSSPLTMFDVSPFQKQAEGIMPSKANHGLIDHHLSSSNGFSNSQTSSSLYNTTSFPVITTNSMTHLLDENNSVNARVSSGPKPPALKVGHLEESTKIDIGAPNKAQSSKQKNHYLRGGGQKNGSGVEWSNHRSRVHFRNHSQGERVLPSTKVKQIYVPKQSNNGGTRAGI